MKMLVFAALLAFVPLAKADQAGQSPSQDMAAVCQAEMDAGTQQLSPACDARLACTEEGGDVAVCQQYCAQYPTDTDACSASDENQMSMQFDRPWGRRHGRRVWFCDHHPFRPRCWWR